MRPSCLRWILSTVGLLWLASLAIGITAPETGLRLPEVVVRSLDQVRLEAHRRGVLPLEPGRVLAPEAFPDLPPARLPRLETLPSPAVRSPGCAYGNPLTSALIRAAGGAEGLYKTALDRLSRDRLDEAAAYLTELRDRYPTAIQADDAGFWLGEIRRRQGRQEEALAFYFGVKGRYRSEARFRRAWLLDRLGRRPEARAAWEELACDEGDPHRVEALYRLGAASLGDGKVGEALGYLTRAREALDAGAPAPEAVRAGVELAVALALRRAGDLEKAEQAFLRFLLKHPDHPDAPAARLALAWTLLERGKPREAALRFRWILDAQPPPEHLGPARYGLAKALIALGDTTGAVAAVRELEAQPDPRPWLGWARADLAWANLERGDYEKALEWYRAALETWEGTGRETLVYMEGESLYLLGRFKEAATALLRVPPESPLRPAALHRAGQCLLLAGKPARAAELFEAVLKKFPRYEDRDRVRVWLGEARFRQGNLEAAREAFSRVPRTSPAYAHALYGLAWVAFQQERWDEAARWFQTFLQRYPDDPNRDEALLTLARAHFNRRELRAALATLSRLEDEARQPRYRSAARYYRGWMLARSGNTTAARAVLGSLIHEEPDGPYTARARHALAWMDFEAGDYEHALAGFRAVAETADAPALVAEARLKVADCLYNLGRYAEALKAYASLPEGADARFGQALCLVQLGDVKGLRASVEAFTRSYPDDPRGLDLLLALAGVLQESGKPAAAAEAYQKAARLGKGSTRAAEARLDAARSLLSAGETRRAREILGKLAGRADGVGLAALRELTTLAEEEGDARGARDLWDRVAARSKGADRVAALRAAAAWARTSGDWEAALKRLRKALEACPPERDDLRQAVLADTGRTLLAAGRPEEAVGPLQEAGDLGKSPEGLRALLLLGRAQEAAGRPQDALETYLRMGYLYPPDRPEVAQGLLSAADILEGAGRPDRARSVLERVAGQAPSPWADQARSRLDSLAPR